MKILLAGPGTGKTTKIEKIISDEFSKAERINVISFTNETVNYLKEKFNHNQNISCSTLHSFALKLNHLPELHIIDNKIESKILLSLSRRLEIDFTTVCEFVRCITFDGMIAKCVAFIKANPAYVEERIGILDLLLVDEFQDFNPDEQQLVKLTSQLAAETIILGDDDQSIYGFKDADPDGIISLYNDKNIEKIKHENICYRCPDEIVEYCIKLISRNKKRVEKDWYKSNKKGNIYFEQLLTQTQCDDYILKTINIIQKKQPDASILVLSPLGIIVEKLKAKLTEQKVDINDCWNEDMDKQLLCMIWWMNAIYGKNKLPYILFLLKYYGNFDKRKLITLLKTKIQTGFKEAELINEIISLNYLPEPLSSFIHIQPTIKEFFNSQNDFEILKEYINEKDIVGSVKNLPSKVKKKKEFEKGKINFMSIHKSKGLQADYVIINGLVSGILPNEARGIDTIEAQRRLLFVGMTRALKELYMVSTVEWQGKDLRSNKADMGEFKFNKYSRKYNGKTSKFVEEIIT
jgi:superfamily I DNA/RNA helicase